MKKWICLILIAALSLLCCAALAESSDASVLSLEELNAWVASYKEKALASEPMNDPADAVAYSEDGYCFIYDFGTIYADRSEMTADTVIRSLVINDGEQEALRGAGVDTLYTAVLNAFYSENPNLDGDRSFAALYVIDTMPESAAWAWVQRDGQRVMTIQYAVHEQYTTGGDGYTDAGLIYTIQDNYVAAIRAYGLDSRVTGEEVRSTLDEVQAVADTHGYTEVPFSLDGSALSVFGTEDLNFMGINFLTLTPEDAEANLGVLTEDQWMEDDDGKWLRIMEFPYCSVTFVYDRNKQNPAVDMMTIDVEGFDGPRGVQVNDSLSTVLNRFRNGEGDYENNREMLYGTEGEAPYGMAEYGDDASAVLYYALKNDEGRTVVLQIYFEMLQVTETDIYFAE